MNRRRTGWGIAAWIGLAVAVLGQEPIRVASDPALSPDGRRLAFSWDGDVWVAPAVGGSARALTRHPGQDRHPSFSPDGRRLTFQSERDGHPQVYTMPIEGGRPRRLTAHSEGALPREWSADGTSILCVVRRDHDGWRPQRLVTVNADAPSGECLVVDAYAEDGTLSPDGRWALVVRGGVDELRKGYRGSKAARIWLFDREEKTWRKVGDDPSGCRSPQWKPGGEGFYYVSGRGGCSNLWEHDLATHADRQLTFFEDDGVIEAAVSRDGSTAIVSRRVGLFRLQPNAAHATEPIRLYYASDRARPAIRRRSLQRVWNRADWGSLDWTSKGREMVFTAGGDAFVMDTVRREPRPLAEGAMPFETEAVFTPDGRAIFLLRDWGDRVEIWRAERADPARPWWQNDRCELAPVVTNRTAKANLSVSPDGRLLAYGESGRNLVVCNADGSGRRVLFESVDLPYYDWSPDAQWMVCSFKDSDDNWDVWIVSANGVPEPANLSLHPYYDAAARWSPDGRMIAFVGERGPEREVDLFYVHVHDDDDRRIHREPGASNPGEMDSPQPDEPADAGSVSAPAAPDLEASGAIDLDGAADRVRRIMLPGSRETSPFWRHDGRTLAFTSTRDGRRGTYQVTFPDQLEPEWMTSLTGYYARWIESDDKLLWLADGIPHAGATPFPFQIHQSVDLREDRRLAFRQIWRTVQDHFYDPDLHGVTWEELLPRYEPLAADAPDHAAFSRVVSMLLGELNASHIGFEVQPDAWGAWVPGDPWMEQTVHLGVRFDSTSLGPGWTVREVLEGGPADVPESRLFPGDRIVALDGRPIEGTKDPAAYLNGPLEPIRRLQVQGEDDQMRRVSLRPITFDEARRLLREARVRRNRQNVRRRSDGAVAYVRVDRMEWEDVARFEEEIYRRGAEARGLILDIRDNEGGFAADSLLSMVSQPTHAFTIPRGGRPGYPRDYVSHRTWDGRLAVLCNEGTASNAEIFAHAIQSWGRGVVIGAPTQGAVLSKMSTQILDLGRLEVPRRGWYRVSDGAPLEGNGVLPDIEIRPLPGEIPAGVDRPLEAAVDALLAALGTVESQPAAPVRTPKEGGQGKVQPVTDR